jgi:hypothetical protein
MPILILDDWVSCGDDHISASENRLNLARKSQSDMQSQLDMAKSERSNFRKQKLKLPLDADIGNICLFICLFVCMSVGMLACLLFGRSVGLSVCRSLCPPVGLAGLFVFDS